MKKPIKLALAKLALAAAIGTFVFDAAAQTTSVDFSNSDSTVQEAKETTQETAEENKVEQKKDPSKLRTKANLKGNPEAKKRASITSDP